MEILFKALLVIHIVAGSIGLSTGTLNIIRKKGDTAHKKAGMFFLYAMLINGFAGFFMAILHQNQFLLIIAVFSIYLTSTGQRYLLWKNPTYKVQKTDWLLSSLMLVAAIGFIIWGALLVFTAENFGIVLLVFGFISILMVTQDFKNYNGKSKFKNFWLLAHIQRMTGAYIAATTAFLVVNNTFLPNIVAWLLPTVIVTPLIFKWSRMYKISYEK
jgi:hypothetical protein